MPTFHPPEWFLTEAMKLGDEYNTRMLALADRFKRDVIIPMCKHHGLTGFNMHDPLFSGDCSFSAPGGVKYACNTTLPANGVYRYPIGPVPEKLAREIEMVSRVLRNAGFEEYLTSVNVSLERE